MAINNSLTAAGFVSLGKGIYIQRAESGRAQAAAVVDMGVSTLTSPTLIMIFGWMGAATAHLLKYTKAYNEMYPSASQILVRCHPSFFWNSESTLATNLTPLLEVLEALGYLKSKTAAADEGQAKCPLRVLTHCFSNGGACMLSSLSHLISSRKLEAPASITSALVLDSNPGYGNIQLAQKAMTANVKNPISILGIQILLITTFAIAWIMGALVQGNPIVFVRMRDELNGVKLLGWMDKKTPRVYLYSELDEMVPFEAVEEHAREAMAMGFDVQLERYKESKHVSHARLDPERYWEAVTSVWQKAVTSSILQL